MPIMAHVSPLRNLHALAEASFIAYGMPPGTSETARGGVDVGEARPAVEVVETFGEIEGEYAALRKGCVMLDQPQRATIEVTGVDRLEFLNRMLTQNLKGMPEGRAARSFWLNRKGRIDADLRLLELGDRTLLDVDVHAAARAAATLAAYIITEDVALADVTPSWHRLALHGPTAIPLLRAVAGQAADALETPGHAATITIASRPVIADRQDAAGETGVELLMRTGDVEAVWHELLEAGGEHDGNGNGAAKPGNGFRLRPAGWHAFNIARVEAGWPVYNIDFGPESLPAETGVLHDRVSFTKGCYLGQEVVARMHALGAPKQVLVALRIEEQPSGMPHASGGAPGPMQPLTGSPVFLPASREDEGEIIGAVTSSVVSPMLGGAPIAFAQVRGKWAEAGAELRVGAENRRLKAAVQPSLRFWPKS